MSKEDGLLLQVTVNALIKRASLYLQQEEAEKCTQDFATAISLDPSNADIYHHRGQVGLFYSYLFQVKPGKRFQ
jgi:import receptor subunit TOM70